MSCIFCVEHICFQARLLYASVCMRTFEVCTYVRTYVRPYEQY